LYFVFVVFLSYLLQSAWSKLRSGIIENYIAKKAEENKHLLLKLQQHKQHTQITNVIRKLDTDNSMLIAGVFKDWKYDIQFGKKKKKLIYCQLKKNSRENVKECNCFFLFFLLFSLKLKFKTII
jgi:hypothetical protein